MIGKVEFLLRETGNLFAISLEGLRKTPDVRHWWKEYLRQCWFIAKVTSLPVTNLQDRQIVKLLQSTELWFVLVMNPDGYQYTFDHERLWRRNLRDNDANGVITGADGVDPNRNYDEHWNYDNEGSSSSSSSDTYRGTAARSEPETEAAAGLIDQVKPKFVVNFHSYGPLNLYPQGWQVGTPDADNPIYAALAGTDANPGIAGFDPGLSSDELYVTNGETTDYAETSVGAISFTPGEVNFLFPGPFTRRELLFYKLARTAGGAPCCARCRWGSGTTSRRAG